MNDLILKNTHPVKQNEWFKFKCCGCGSCCKHVKDSVPIESLDAYRMAKYLQCQDQSIHTIDEVLYKYAVPAPLDKCGYFVYMLKTTEKDDACVFLKDNRCTIHAAKPRACRTYPLCAQPTGEGFQYYLCTEQDTHSHGKSVKVKNFVNQYFTQEDQTFVHLDFFNAVPIADLLRQIPEYKKEAAIMFFLRYKYSDYALDKPFQEQYEANIHSLLDALKKLIS